MAGKCEPDIFDKMPPREHTQTNMHTYTHIHANTHTHTLQRRYVGMRATERRGYLQMRHVKCSVLQCVAVCCSVLQGGAVWCSVVQCGAVC